MNIPATTALTTEQLLAFPDDGVQRWLVNGHLRERPETYRDRFSAATLAHVVTALDRWCDEQPAPRGLVLGGNSGVRLRRNPDTTVGVDALYVTADVVARQTEEMPLLDGVPVLIVAIRTPTTTQQEIDENVDLYLNHGVRVVWVIDPRDRTVRIYRPGQRPQFVNDAQELVGDPELPGFRVSVSSLFD